MRTIALIGNKGGAGKTTLCVNLATALHDEDNATVILDADPQHSSLQWKSIAEDQASIQVLPASDDVEQTFNDLPEGFAHCVIDCPPSAQSQQMHDALRLADLAVVPVLPSPLDIWATVHIEQAVSAAREHNPDLKVLLVINQFESRTRLSQLMERALAELELPSAQAFVKRRAIYRHSFLEGRTVHDAGSRGREASAEIHQLIEEMEKCL